MFLLIVENFNRDSIYVFYSPIKLLNVLWKALASVGSEMDLEI